MGLFFSKKDSKDFIALPIIFGAFYSVIFRKLYRACWFSGLNFKLGSFRFENMVDLVVFEG